MDALFFQFDHLVPGDVDRVAKLIDEKRDWVNKSVAALEKTPKTDTPPIRVSQFYSERDAFEAVSKPILRKPKPKVDPPPTPKDESAKGETKSDDNDQKKTSPEDGAQMETEQPQVNGGSTMELD